MDEDKIAVIIISAIFAIASIPLFRIAYRQHKERGFVYTNKWLYASQKEREEMDPRIKKAEYRVGRNVFFMLGVLLLLCAIYFLVWQPWLGFIGYALMVIIIVYALYQWISNNRVYKAIEEEKSRKDNS